MKDWSLTGGVIENKKSKLKIMRAWLLTVREGRPNIKRKKTTRDSFSFGRLELFFLFRGAPAAYGPYQARG